MSPSAYITVRTTKSGKRWIVRYRLGGRYSKLIHAGSFKTRKDALARRDFVIGEIAAGRDPRRTLQEAFAPVVSRGMREWCDAYVESRLDVADATLVSIRANMKRIIKEFGDRDPRTLTVDDAAAFVAKLTGELAPGSVYSCFSRFRALLDYAGVDPNPARHRNIRLPRVVSDVPAPPTASQVAAILSAVPAHLRLPLRVLDATGMRVGEVAELERQDVDVRASRFRIRRGKTNAARRWVSVPRWLMDELEEVLRAETERWAFPVSGATQDPAPHRSVSARVFPEFTTRRARSAMTKACEDLGLPHFHPHDLRHRFASVQIAAGTPITDLAAQLGHARKSVTLNVYGHVLLPEGDE